MESLILAFTAAVPVTLLVVAVAFTGLAFGLSIRQTSQTDESPLESENQWLRTRVAWLEGRVIDLAAKVAFERMLAANPNVLDLRPGGPIREPRAH